MKPVEELMALVRKYGEVHFLGKDDGGAAFHAIRAHAERLCAPSACPEGITDERIEQMALASGLDEELWFGRFTPQGYEDTLPKLRRFAEQVLSAAPAVPVGAEPVGFPEPPKRGVEVLRNAIALLREEACYRDDEGEDTDALEDLLAWLTSEPVADLMQHISDHRRLKPAHPVAQGAAAPVVAEPAAWQPIETAPHDKTTVALLHANADGYRRYGVGWYMPLTGWQGWGDAAPPPTHWMPLPAHPPAPQGQQKEKT